MNPFPWFEVVIVIIHLHGLQQAVILKIVMLAKRTIENRPIAILKTLAWVTARNIVDTTELDSATSMYHQLLSRTQENACEQEPYHIHLVLQYLHCEMSFRAGQLL
jgi:hypothetical protein